MLCNITDLLYICALQEILSIMLLKRKYTLSQKAAERKKGGGIEWEIAENYRWLHTIRARSNIIATYV